MLSDIFGCWKQQSGPDGRNRDVFASLDLPQEGPSEPDRKPCGRKHRFLDCGSVFLQLPTGQSEDLKLHAQRYRPTVSAGKRQLLLAPGIVGVGGICDDVMMRCVMNWREETITRKERLFVCPR